MFHSIPIFRNFIFLSLIISSCNSILVCARSHTFLQLQTFPWHSTPTGDFLQLQMIADCFMFFWNVSTTSGNI